MTAFQTVILIAKLITLPILVGSLEFLFYPSVLADEGLMGWPINRLRTPWMCSGTSGRILSLFLSYSAVRLLLTVRIVLALIILLLPWGKTLHPLLFIALVITEWLFVVRSPYGKDGSDQLMWLTVLTLTLAALVPEEAVLHGVLLFLTFQICMSYFVAGVAKASARGWWSGRYLTAVANMKIYGNARAGRFLMRNPLAAIVLSRGVIVWECSFPFLLLLPYPYVVVVLISGLLFHLTTAVFMGLNCFFLAFAALYPALYYITNHGIFGFGVGR